MKSIIMSFGALAIAGAVPVLAQTPPPPAPDTTMAPPAAPTPPAADGSMAPAQPGSMSGGSTPSGSMSSGGTSSGSMQSSGMQSSMPAPTTGPLPMCSAKIKDRCQQSPADQSRALSAAQAEKTGGVGNRPNDSMGGDAAMGKKMMGKKHTMHHRMMHKSTTTTSTTPAAN